MTLKQNAGIFLIVAGIFVIAFDCFAIYSAITGKYQSPHIFSQSKSTNSALKPANPQDIGQMINSALQSSIAPILTDSLPQLFDFIAWTMLVWLFIVAGGKIAEIGIKLL